MAYLLIFLLLVCFPLPWIWVAHAKPFREAADVDWIDGISMGFGIAVCLLYLCSLHSLFLFQWIWLASIAVAIGVLIVSFRRRTETSVSWGSEARILVLLIAIYIAIRAVPLSVAEYPLGGDPSYHLVLADKILRVGGFITDLRPFEEMELNYPIGSHLLLALIADVGKVPVHKIFTLTMIVFTGLTGAQVYALVSRATRNAELGLYAGLSYLFLAVFGSLDYARWGGLPNLIGVYMVVGLLSALHREDLSERKTTALFAVLFLAASLVHHHVMLTAGCILVWQLLYFHWIRPDRTQTRRLTLGLALSAVLGAPYFLPYLLKTSQLKETQLIGFYERWMTPDEIMNALGPAFFLSVLAGVLIFLNRKWRQYFSENLLQAVLCLLVIYVLLQYVSPVLSIAITGGILTPFVPSRFLTDSVALLAAFSALFFFQLKTWSGLSKSWVVGLIFSGFMLNWPVYRQTFDRRVSEPNLEAYEWIRNNTPTNAIIMDQNVYASYLTQRASSSMMLPASEFLSMATNWKMTQEISQGRVPLGAQGRQILFITYRMPPPFVDGRVVWRHPSGRLSITEVQGNGGFQRQ
jgi:hypothetical protein